MATTSNPAYSIATTTLNVLRKVGRDLQRRLINGYLTYSRDFDKLSCQRSNSSQRSPASLLWRLRTSRQLRYRFRSLRIHRCSIDQFQSFLVRLPYCPITALSALVHLQSPIFLTSEYWTHGEAWRTGINDFAYTASFGQSLFSPQVVPLATSL